MAKSLCDQLYPESDGESREAAMREAQATSGFLRLAQEFEAEFGRTTLNERVRALVPDGDYDPDDLHRRLLMLPWSDVFTTNWDTLLERACRDVFDRTYDVIRTNSEISVAMRPRIVKLHGSFPAYEPFIFTEEDYRTYPARFAPFVNLVQQAMMEHAFCLVGFSGDDPNFLHWSGWVRDNFKGLAPKIYLVGWLDLSKQRRRMLEDRSVLPIDFALLPDAQKWPDRMRHRYSIEWFLSALELGRPVNPSTWPLSRVSSVSSNSTPGYLGPIPAPARSMPQDELLAPDPRVTQLAERLATLRATLAVWAGNRRLYPGWLVAPPAVRSRIWRSTQEWINELLKVAPELLPVERLLALKELIWRLDIALLPIFDQFEKMCVDLLNAIDCQEKTITLPNGSKEQPTDVDWPCLRDAYCTVVLAIARTARNRGDEKTFNDWLDRLAMFVHDIPGIAGEIWYERCLWCLDRLDHELLDKALVTWDPAKSEPIWSLRKAGILAEIDRNQDAITLLKEALGDIRRHRRRDFDDLPALSREAWALWLVLAYRLGFPSRDTELPDTPEPSDRWRELAVHDCDAGHQYSSLLAEMRTSDEVPSGVVKESSFDLGRRRTSVHLRSGIPTRVLASYQMLRLVEITGLPHRANNAFLLKEGLEEAARELADVEPWSMTLRTLRIASGYHDKILDKFFTRSRIALYSVEHVDGFRNILMRQIQYALPRCSGPGMTVSFWVDRLEVALEVFSRLTLRFSTERARETLALAMSFYRNNTFVRSLILIQPLSSLLSRAIETLPTTELARALPDLFDLPIPPESDFIPASLAGWPEPAALLPSNFVLTESTHDTRDARWSRIVSRLLAALGSDHAQRRQRALRRLLRLHEWKLLSPHESGEFGRILWEPEHLDKYGLPHDHGLMDWVLLILPEAEVGQAERAFREKYLSTSSDTNQPSLSHRLFMIGAVLEGSEKLNAPFVLSRDDRLALTNLVLEWATAENPSGLHPLLLQRKLHQD